MNKIILTSDGYRFSKSAFDFVRRLNDMQQVLVSGLFLPEIVYPGAYGFTGRGMVEMPALQTVLRDYDEEVLEENVKTFKELCEENSMEYRVHKHYGDFALPQLKKETRYADLLAISSDLFFRNTFDNETEDYIKITLHHAECPVLLLPEKCEFPEQIILAYDGSESSVYAIKQFYYLFPELCRKNTLLVYASNKEKELPDSSYIEELAPRHFRDLDMMVLPLDSKSHFKDWLSTKPKSLLVTGAYDRSAFSEIFRKSFGEDIIMSQGLPVFVAHK